VKDELIALIGAELAAWQPGHPLDPDTVSGAVVDRQQLDTILSYIKAGKEAGATLVCGGEQVHAESGGVYVEPTVFMNVHNQMKIASEEIFGPVLSVIEFNGMEEAIAIANDTIYGLAAGVWTSDISKAHKTAKALRTGMVWINHYDGGDMTAPFGGYKQSGNGRDKSLHSFDKYTEIKATWIAL
ncbi:MAG: aldehyde dehydrogenase family protein, partial [Shewanella sp.]